MKLFLSAAAAVVISGSVSYGQVPDAWSGNAGDNSFENAGNWATPTGPAVPGPGNTIYVFPGFISSTGTLGGNPAVVVTSGGATIININASSSHSVSNLVVSSTFATPLGSPPVSVPGGTLNLNMGTNTLTLTPPISGATTPAALEVLGGSTLNFTGNMDVNGDVTVGSIASTIDSGSNQIGGPGSLNFKAGVVNMDGFGSFVVGEDSLGRVTQSTGSQVITGSGLFIGFGSSTAGASTYTVNSGAELDLGTAGGLGASSNYSMAVGEVGGVGTLTVNGTFNATNGSATDISIGNGGTGTFTQTAGSTVNIDGNIFLGSNASSGTINIQGGTFNFGPDAPGFLEVGTDAGSLGTINMSAGTMNIDAGSVFILGMDGNAAFNMSGGTLNLNDPVDSLDINSAGSGSGVFTQTGGTVNAAGDINIGAGSGTGTYTLTGGTLNAGGNLNIGTAGGTGIFNFNGGTLNLTGALNIGSTGSFNLLSGTFSTNGGTFTGNGNFNFSGGTLAITGTDLTTSYNGTVTNSSTIDTTGGNATFNGNLTGTGNLTVTGGRSVNFNGTGSSGSWGISVKGSSIVNAATVASISGTGPVRIGSGSTFNLGSSGNPSDTFSGAISDFHDAAGPATFTTGGNQLILTKAVNLSINSQTIIGAGGSLQLNAGGTLSNVDGSAGSGTNTLVVNGGKLNLLGTNTLSQVVVNTGSTLKFADVTGSVLNSGTMTTLGTATAPTTTTIGGNLVSANAGNSLVFNLIGSAVDSFAVGGTGLLNDTTVKINGFGTVNNVAIVTTAGGLTTNNVNALSTALLTITLTNDGNDLLLSTVQNPLTLFAKTPNEQAVANSLDPILLSGGGPSGAAPIFTRLNQLPASAIPEALESLTPESLQYSRIIAFENSTQLVQRMDGIAANLRNSVGGLDTSAISITSPAFASSLGRSMNQLLAFHDPAPNGVNYYPGTGGSSGSSPEDASISSGSGPRPASSSSSVPVWNSDTRTISDSPEPATDREHPIDPSPAPLSEFVSGDLVLANLNPDSSASNAPSTKGHYAAADATAGIAYRMTSNLSLGVLFNYNHTDAHTDGAGSKTSIDSYTPGIFATFFDKGFYLNGLFAFGYNDYNNNRNIAFMGQDANSHPDGYQYTANIDGGYDFHPNRDWIVGPALGVTYSHLDVDSFTESGAPGSDLNVESQSADSLRTRLGGHLIYQTDTGSVLLQPNISAFWQHEFLNDSSGITSSFNDFSASSFTINTAAPTRDTALITVGVSASFNSSIDVYLNYIADIGTDDYFAQSVVGGFKAKF